MPIITADQIKVFQQSWANAVVSQDIHLLMALYAPNAVLKPTLSNAIRRSPEDIKHYFIGGGKYNDNGFFNQNFSKVVFVESAPVLLGTVAIDTGIYEFSKKDEPKVAAHFTFCLQNSSEEKLIIISQHSSLLIEE